MAKGYTISGKTVQKGQRGTSGKHGAANQGVGSGTTGKKGRAKNPATAKVQADGHDAQGGGPGGGQ